MSGAVPPGTFCHWLHMLLSQFVPNGAGAPGHTHVSGHFGPAEGQSWDPSIAHTSRTAGRPDSQGPRPPSRLNIKRTRSACKIRQNIMELTWPGKLGNGIRSQLGRPAPGPGRPHPAREFVVMGPQGPPSPFDRQLEFLTNRAIPLHRPGPLGASHPCTRRRSCTLRFRSLGLKASPQRTPRSREQEPRGSPVRVHSLVLASGGYTPDLSVPAFWGGVGPGRRSFGSAGSTTLCSHGRSGHTPGPLA